MSSRLSLFFRRFLLSLTPRLRVVSQNVEAVFAPIRTAERARQGLSIADVVLETAAEAVSVDLTSAAVQTMRKIFAFSQCVAAHAATFILFQRPRWLHWAFLKLLVLRLFAILLIAASIILRVPAHEDFLLFRPVWVKIYEESMLRRSVLIPDASLVLPEPLHGLAELLLDSEPLPLPITVRAVPQQGTLSALQDLLKLRICEA